MARKTLYELTSSMPDITIEEVDIVTNPLRAWRDGVRFIPTLKSGDNMLTGVFLGREEMLKFLQTASGGK